MYMVAARLGCERAAVGGPPLALTAWAGLKKPTLTLQGVGFWQGRLLGL